MRNINAREQMTDREREEFEQEKTAAQISGDYHLKAKEMELEVAKLEAKWSSWLKLPIIIITLPVRILFALGFVVCMARKSEPSEAFWEFMQV